MWWQCNYCYEQFGSKDAGRNHTKDSHPGFRPNLTNLSLSSYEYYQRSLPYRPMFPGYGYGSGGYGGMPFYGAYYPQQQQGQQAGAVAVGGGGGSSTSQHSGLPSRRALKEGTATAATTASSGDGQEPEVTINNHLTSTASNGLLTRENLSKLPGGASGGDGQRGRGAFSTAPPVLPDGRASARALGITAFNSYLRSLTTAAVIHHPYLLSIDTALQTAGEGNLRGLYDELHTYLSALLHATPPEGYPDQAEIAETLVRRAELYYATHPNEDSRIMVVHPAPATGSSSTSSSHDDNKNDGQKKQGS